MYTVRREAMTEYRDDIEEMEEDDERTFGEWLQDNLRIIISVIIVLLLALGIYSYSKRTQDARIAMTSEETATTESVQADDDDGILSQIGNAVKGSAKDATDATTAVAKKATQEVKDATGSVATKDDAVNKTTAQKDASAKKVTKAKTVAADTEATDAYVMVAQRGDGKTHLARRALALYLAKNATEGLTDAHKVYIEDYLQKAVGGSSMLMVGQEIRFSKDLVKQAITRSQNLTEAQLTHLQKYVR